MFKLDYTIAAIKNFIMVGNAATKLAQTTHNQTTNSKTIQKKVLTVKLDL